MLREAEIVCPTGEIVVEEVEEIEEVEEVLPWQLRAKVASGPRPEDLRPTWWRRSAMRRRRGCSAGTTKPGWGLFAEHRGDEVVATGDGFFVGFDSPEEVLACAVATQRRLDEHRHQNGFAPRVRIGCTRPAHAAREELLGARRPGGEPLRRHCRREPDHWQGDAGRLAVPGIGAEDREAMGTPDPADDLTMEWR